MRSSEHLHRQQVHNLAFAADFACYTNLHLTRATTINFRVVGIADRDAHQFISAYTKYFGDWLSTQGTSRAYLWTLENVGGLHVHMFSHVPANLKKNFKDLERSWLVACGGKFRTKGMRRKQFPEPGINFADGHSGYMPAFCWWMRYLLKGVDPKCSEETGIVAKPQGLVFGKRSGCSESLGPKARARSGILYERDTHSGKRLLRPLALDLNSPACFWGD
jgi:hypothetical protein